MKACLDLYNIFYTVATYGSISAAAKALFISQPAITFQIKKLEEQLETTLFTRTKHGMVLTNEGELLFDYIKNAIDNIHNGENALSNLKNLEFGTIRIGVSTTLCRNVLMPYLEQFHQKYPNIDIQINNNVSDNLIKELRNGNLDLLILFSPNTDSNDLNIIPIKEVQDIFVGNKIFHDLLNNRITLKDLNQYPLIFPKLTCNSGLSLYKLLKNNSIQLKPKIEVVSYVLTLDLIKAGFGVGFVTKEFIKDELDKQQLFEIKTVESIPKRTIVIATANKKQPSYCVKKLIEIIQNK